MVTHSSIMGPTLKEIHPLFNPRLIPNGVVNRSDARGRKGDILLSFSDALKEGIELLTDECDLFPVIVTVS